MGLVALEDWEWRMHGMPPSDGATIGDFLLIVQITGIELWVWEEGVAGGGREDASADDRKQKSRHKDGFFKILWSGRWESNPRL